MREKQIHEVSDTVQLRELYETAFPKEEQIPWDELTRLVVEMPLDFTAHYDNDTFIGLTIVYPRKSINWFWYFAVREELRGKGYGQEILTSLIKRHDGKPFILDMESPDQPCDNMEQRVRRHSFYKRNGFRDTNVYRSFDGITYTIMMRGEGKFTKDDYDEIIEDLRRFWQPE